MPRTVRIIEVTDNLIAEVLSDGSVKWWERVETPVRRGPGHKPRDPPERLRLSQDRRWKLGGEWCVMGRRMV